MLVKHMLVYFSSHTDCSVSVCHVLVYILETHCLNITFIVDVTENQSANIAIVVIANEWIS